MRFKARELMSEKRILAAEADDDVAAARDDEEVRHAANSCGQMRSKRTVIRVDPLGRSDGIALERLIPNASGALLQINIHHIKPGAKYRRRD